MWHPANEARSDLTELAESELNKRPKLQSHTSAQFHPVGRATRNVLELLNPRFNGLTARCWNLENTANGARIPLRRIVGQSSVTMSAEDAVDAGLAGLDAGEDVTIPGLHEADAWTDWEANRRQTSNKFGERQAARSLTFGAESSDDEHRHAVVPGR